ncbi:gluconate 2-dehydrogenase gamma chain [Salsuginibacillus halophilus]|uniref:Gluconate 2-dehydrogenase gamma chain n=1 Tax=Salsuginibacillus halophilus TaxID=517424 RepID=A0A2P8HWL3_9BACI|nr:gluconate 2-dehydrogenase subunit 3 family protein [Salsuginibacillus halophilus]PSL50631.1 gluconate 2-dehydrogenase gamma chain [Salsuginibacillus halophilus]
MADEQETGGVTRREFLKNSGLVVGGAVGGTVLGGVLGRELFPAPQQGASPEEDTSDSGNGGAETPDYTEARMFFKREEDFRVLSAAVERIFPEDDLGPGAIALGVPYYIDKQLAGGYGRNAREYMQGPFFEGAETQGYQSGLLRQEAFLQGVRKIQQESESRTDDAYFDAEEDTQDEILEAFEAGDIEMEGINATTFFGMLRQATLEGVYADPVYGGNRNMGGWRLKDYPGAQMAYIQMIEEDEFVEMDPISLHDHHT